MFGAWLSLVERLLWEQNVAGSNPVAPTKKSDARRAVTAFIFSLPQTREQNQKIRPILDGFFMFDGLKIKREKTQGFRHFLVGAAGIEPATPTV